MTREPTPGEGGGDASSADSDAAPSVITRLMAETDLPVTTSSHSRLLPEPELSSGPTRVPQLCVVRKANVQSLYCVLPSNVLEEEREPDFWFSGNCIYF